MASATTTFLQIWWVEHTAGSQFMGLSVFGALASFCGPWLMGIAWVKGAIQSYNTESWQYQVYLFHIWSYILKSFIAM